MAKDVLRSTSLKMGTYGEEFQYTTCGAVGSSILKVSLHHKPLTTKILLRPTYDRLSWKEASVLAQVRTGMARLNSYVYRINVTDTDQCACGQARETVEHFLFRCRK
jgi:hypothetical protein